MRRVTSLGRLVFVAASALLLAGSPSSAQQPCPASDAADPGPFGFRGREREPYWVPSSLDDRPSPGGYLAGDGDRMWRVGYSAASLWRDLAYWSPKTRRWTRVVSESGRGLVDGIVAGVVATGTGLLVFGGTEADDRWLPMWVLRYDAQTNRWSRSMATDAPPDRKDALDVWTGKELLSFGGCLLPREGWCDPSAGGLYDPKLDRWRQIWVPSYSEDDWSKAFGGAWTGDRLVVWGWSQKYSKWSLDEYDPDSDSWTSHSQLPLGVPGPALSGAWSGRWIVIATAQAILRYDLADRTWVSFPAPSDGSSPRFVTTAVDGRIVVGGTKGWNRLWLFDPESGRLIPLPQAPFSGVEILARCPLGNGILAFRPSLPDWGEETPSDQIALLDVRKEEWAWGFNPFPPARVGALRVWTGSELLVVGGMDDRGSTVPGGERFDPTTGEWRSLSMENAPSSLSHWYEGLWIGDGFLVFVWDKTRVYDPRSDRWRSVPFADARCLFQISSPIWTGREILAMTDFGILRMDPETGTCATVPLEPSLEGKYIFSEWTGRELLVWGRDSGPNGSSILKGFFFDPQNDRWRPMPTVGDPGPLGWAASLWVEGRLVLAGAIWDWSRPAGVAIWDSATGIWTEIPPPPGETVFDGDGDDQVQVVRAGRFILLWRRRAGSIQGDLRWGWLLDLETGEWRDLPTKDAPPSDSSGFPDLLAWTGTEVLIWGENNGGRLGFERCEPARPDAEEIRPTDPR